MRGVQDELLGQEFGKDGAQGAAPPAAGGRQLLQLIPSMIPRAQPAVGRAKWIDGNRPIARR